MAHANLMAAPSLLDGVFIIGWCGVDFFFVLSGFIIYYVHSADIGNPSRFVNYITKRIIRIYPIYWLYTLGALAFDYSLFLLTGKHLIAWISLDWAKIAQSLLLWPTNVAINEMPILPVAWTLSYEIFFYIIFGIMLLVRPWISILLVSMWLIFMYCASLGLIEQRSPILFVLLNPRNLEFMLGCFAGYIARNNRREIHENYIVWMIVFGALLLMLSWYNAYTQYHLFRQLHVVQFGLPFFIIVLGLALLGKTKSTEMGQLKKAALYLGDASYSIYLIHFLCVDVLSIIFRKIAPFSNSNAALTFTVTVFISVAIGCLFYAFIEKPLLRWMGSRVLSK